ncbi:MAG: hypothetical protein GQ557_01340 [Mycoplasmataceae bacterium]|nr:hypothetical protein [Mycoplasmataceae bacterium]
MDIFPEKIKSDNFYSKSNECFLPTPFPKYPTIITVIGGIGSGKSHIVQNILKNSVFDLAVIYNSGGDSKYDMNFKDFKKNNKIPDSKETTYRILDDKEELIKILENDKNNPNKLTKALVMDDCLGDKELFDPNGNSEFCRFLTSSRNRHWFVFLIGHDSKYVPKKVRGCTGAYLTFKLNDNDMDYINELHHIKKFQIDKIRKEFGNLLYVQKGKFFVFIDNLIYELDINN